MITTLKRNILKLGRWCEANHLTLIFLCGAYILGFIGIWSVSLLFGYWANALWAMHFELNAGYTFMGTIATAAVSVFGIAWTANSKYKTDSELNSPQGKKPTYEGNDAGG